MPTFNTPAPLLQELGLNNKINYTHGKPYYGKLHTRTAVLWKAIFSVLKLVTHTHPTMPNMFISLLKVDQALGSIYEAEIHCINESTHDEYQ